MVYNMVKDRVRASEGFIIKRGRALINFEKNSLTSLEVLWSFSTLTLKDGLIDNTRIVVDKWSSI